MIDKLIDNAFHADERLARANEICFKCAEENHRLVTLVDKIASIFEHNVDYMHQERGKLIDYILTHSNIEIHNKNEV